MRFETPDGHLQVDDSYENLAVRHSGAISSLTRHYTRISYYDDIGGATQYVSLFSITVTCDTPVIALTSGALARAVKSGTSWTFYIWRNTNSAGGGLSSSDRYFIFDKPQPTSSTSGLILRDAAGALCFHSDYKYLRVVANDPFAGVGSSSDWVYNKTLSTGSKILAHIPMTTQFWAAYSDRQTSGSIQYEMTFQYAKVSSTTVRAAPLFLSAFDTDFPTGYAPTAHPKAMLIDVTNF